MGNCQRKKRNGSKALHTSRIHGRIQSHSEAKREKRA